MYPPPRQTNSMAIVALVSSLIVPPVGIVCGHIALSQIRRTGEEGRGMAIAGLVVGYIYTAFLVLMFLFWLVMLVWFANEINNLPTTTPTYGTYSMQP